jgi:hypothetical protein
MVASKRSEDGQERKSPLADSGFADDRPANPVARIFKETANDSPSPPTELGERVGVARELKSTLLITDEENCRCQNHFGML